MSLRDSSALANDRNALRARLAEDGYLFFPGLVRRDRVLELRSLVLAELAQRGWLADGSDPADALPDSRIRAEVFRSMEELEAARRDDGWFGGYRAIQSLEAFHELAFDEALLDAVRMVVADDAFPHPRKIARVVYPRDPKLTTAPHQDYTHIQGTADFVTCWLPLGDYSQGEGGLRVLRASGHRGVYPVQKADGAGGVGSKVDEHGPGWLTTDFRAGDVLLFHSLTVHAGTPNLSDRLRLSVDYRFQSASAPITRESLAPHMSSNLPDWSQLSRGWKTTRWVEPPDDLTLVDFVSPAVGLDHWHEVIPAPVSQLVEVRS